MKMKVKDLIKILSKLPQNTQVIIAKSHDGEEKISPVDSISEQVFKSYGDRDDRYKDLGDILDSEYAEEEGIKNNCVVLWPKN